MQSYMRGKQQEYQVLRVRGDSQRERSKVTSGGVHVCVCSHAYYNRVKFILPLLKGIVLFLIQGTLNRLPFNNCVVGMYGTTLHQSKLHTDRHTCNKHTPQSAHTFLNDF